MKTHYITIPVMGLDFFRLKEQDLPFFLDIRNRVKDDLHDSREFTLIEAIEWLPKSKTQYWIISHNSLNVGYFRLSRLSDSSWQIGADIHPSFQRQGLASKAYPAFINEIVKKINPTPTSLELRVLKKNLAALSLYAKLGFTIQEVTEVDFRMTLDFE
jgi:RimJ/RimL family protein N-acetyltransferase